jgi:hypothetical protein
MNELGERFMRLAITLVAVAFLLQWAWRMAAPLIPVVVIGLIGWVVVRLVQRRRQNW